MPSLPAKTKFLLILAKNSCKIEIKLFCCTLFHMKTTVSLRYFVILVVSTIFTEVDDCNTKPVRYSHCYQLLKRFFEIFVCLRLRIQ